MILILVVVVSCSCVIFCIFINCKVTIKSRFQNSRFQKSSSSCSLINECICDTVSRQPTHYDNTSNDPKFPTNRNRNRNHNQ